MNRKYIDLSHVIKDGMITYKGLPAPIICDYLSRVDSEPFYEEGTSFQIGKIELVGNTGTYLDCPFHRYENGKDLAAIDLQHFVDLETLIIQAPFEKGLAIGINYFKDKDLKDKAVLVHTGWSKYWGSDQYFENHPFVTEAAALFLKEQNISLIGIDSHNIDDTRSNSRPVHSILLKAEILIVEHLTNLDKINTPTCLFTAAPPKFEGVGTFPVRAFATIKN